MFRGHAQYKPAPIMARQIGHLSWSAVRLSEGARPLVVSEDIETGLLLRDFADILEESPCTKIGSTQLWENLCDLEDAPWTEWRPGGPTTPRGVTKYLKPFGITPRRDRIGSFIASLTFQMSSVDTFLADPKEPPQVPQAPCTLQTSLKNLWKTKVWHLVKVVAVPRARRMPSAIVPP